MKEPHQQQAVNVRTSTVMWVDGKKVVIPLPRYVDRSAKVRLGKIAPPAVSTFFLG